MIDVYYYTSGMTERKRQAEITGIVSSLTRGDHRSMPSLEGTSQAWWTQLGSLPAEIPFAMVMNYILWYTFT